MGVHGGMFVIFLGLPPASQKIEIKNKSKSSLVTSLKKIPFAVHDELSRVSPASFRFIDEMSPPGGRPVNYT